MEDHEKVKNDLRTLGGLDVNLFKIFATLLFFGGSQLTLFSSFNYFLCGKPFVSLLLFDID